MKVHDIRNLLFSFIGLSMFLVLAGRPAAQEDKRVTDSETKVFHRTVQPFLRQNCIRCHGAKETNGDIRLDELTADFADGVNAQHWKSVMDAINIGAMPPEDEKQPPGEKLTQVSDWILDQLREAKRRAGGSSGVIRHLNNQEYRNTIRDLFADMDYDPTQPFLDDEVVNGFDNDGTRMFTSSYSLREYLVAGKQVAERAIVLGDKPPTIKQTWLAKDLVKEKEFVKKNWQRVASCENHKDGVIRNETNYGRLGGSRFAPAKFRVPASGIYAIRAKGYGISPAGSPVILGLDKGASNHTFFPTGLTRVANLNFSLNEMNTYEVFTHLDSGDAVSLRFVNGTQNRRNSDLFNSVLLHSLEVEGPLSESWPPERTQVVTGPEFKDIGDFGESAQGFLLRAYRRPPTSAEIRFFIDHVKRRMRENHSLEESIEIAVQFVLASPEFLFLKEKPGPLDDYAIASRLSYFLWSTMPDEKLFELAHRGQLREPVVLRQQFERMLADSKSEQFIKQFTGQWLGTRLVDDMRPDPKLFPTYNRNLELAMIGETEAFFKEILSNNLSVLNFLDSDFAVLDQTMAEFYGIPDVEGPEFRRVALKPEYHRGGVMTQANMLRHTSLDYRTHPIRRGIWVLENLLGSTPPPPPPDVPPIEPDVRGASTLRERLALHRKHSSCNGCHRKIDPYGLALENFDAIGAWREMERPEGANRRSKSLPVDASGDMPNGEHYETFEQFRSLVATEQDKFSRCFVEKIMSFALGRSLDFSDEETIGHLVSVLKKNDHRMQDLILSLIQSDAFLTK